MNRGEKGMGMFVINGGNKLHGSLFVKGENSMLPIMAAQCSTAAMNDNLYNIPDIYDMHNENPQLGEVHLKIMLCR